MLSQDERRFLESSAGRVLQGKVGPGQPLAHQQQSRSPRWPQAGSVPPGEESARVLGSVSSWVGSHLVPAWHPGTCPPLPLGPVARPARPVLLLPTSQALPEPVTALP